MKPIRIESRLGTIDGYLTDGIAFFDFPDLKAKKMVRHIILLDEGVKIMYEPWGWKNEWYVDLIEIIRNDEKTIKIIDRQIDIIIEGEGPTYRVIDLEDFGDAIEKGNMNLIQAKRQLRNMQNFLDNYLHGKNFPPKKIVEILEVNI